MFSQKSISKVSIVVPVYNEEGSLPELIRRTDSSCRVFDRDYDIILVDDGSNDRSAELIQEAANQPDSHIFGVLLNRNYGQHSAIMAGFEVANSDLVITIDADLQNPPEEIPRLVFKADEGFDVVGTVRKYRKDSLFRRMPSAIINGGVRRATGVKMSDYGCMLRAYRRHIIDAMLQSYERSTFIPILANNFARKTTEIDVDHAEREFGDSKYGVMKLINLMCNLVTCMTSSPLYLLSIMGYLLTGLGFLFTFLLIILRLIQGPEWYGNSFFTIFSVLFIFVGAQFIGMRLLGEYIGRIYRDVRTRPLYFIQKIIHQGSTTSSFLEEKK